MLYCWKDTDLMFELRKRSKKKNARMIRFWILFYIKRIFISCGEGDCAVLRLLFDYRAMQLAMKVKIPTQNRKTIMWLNPCIAPIEIFSILSDRTRRKLPNSHDGRARQVLSAFVAGWFNHFARKKEKRVEEERRAAEKLNPKARVILCGAFWSNFSFMSFFFSPCQSKHCMVHVCMDGYEGNLNFYRF